MNYSETLSFLYEQLPMYHRIGTAAYKENIDNTISICKLLGNPHLNFKSVHIAGTNGKGSVSHQLASILIEAGYKTGLYTSPHLKDFRERIRINNKMISKSYVKSFVKKHTAVFSTIKPSFFEWTVGLAFDYFSTKRVDIAIIETGLGGRLDSTNIISPELSVITNISLDHTNLLGDSLEKIAYEKAGIIKSQIPVVIGESQEGVAQIFIEKARDKSSQIYFADKEYEAVNFLTGNYKNHFQIRKKGSAVFVDYYSPLAGNYQKKNFTTVICCINILNNKGFNISTSAISEGIINVVKNTGLKGRWEILGRKPLVICDTAHNEAGLNEVMMQLNTIKHEKLHIVLGMVNDKNTDSILKLFPKDAVYYFCKPDIPRGLDAEILQIEAKKFELGGNYFLSVKEAFSEAKKNACKNDIIYVGGSTFVVAEVI